MLEGLSDTEVSPIYTVGLKRVRRVMVHRNLPM